MSKTTNVVVVVDTWGFDALSTKKKFEGGVSETKSFSSFILPVKRTVQPSSAANPCFPRQFHNVNSFAFAPSSLLDLLVFFPGFDGEIGDGAFGLPSRREGLRANVFPINEVVSLVLVQDAANGVVEILGRTDGYGRVLLG